MNRVNRLKKGQRGMPPAQETHQTNADPLGKPRNAIAVRRPILVLLSLLSLLQTVAIADDDLDFFEKKIRPVLIERCHKCHSGSSGKIKGGLRLDRRSSLLQGGDSGPTIVPGKPAESLLLAALNWSGSTSEMPPDGKLPARVIADFREWIARGAVFPVDADAPSTSPQPQSVDIEAGRGFWSFQPVTILPTPVVSDSNWPQRKIDFFILERLDQQALKPASSADRRTLLRRLSYDLTGLPPALDEIAAFEADPSLDAVERVVDRLLAASQYGERWARHWLDIARYAEDNPTSEATCKPPRFPFRYRDWLIRALNDDLPYDEFIRRQLAADLLDVEPEEIAALGFLGLSPVYHKEPKLSADVISVIVADEWDERVDTITRGFLGLTVACARCHDHKFDPIRTDDYYALAGIMASTQLVEWPLVKTSVDEAAALTEIQRQIVDVELRFDYAKKQRATAKLRGEDLAPYEAEVVRQEEQLKALKATALFEGPIANAARDAGLWLNGDDPTWTLLDYRPGQGRDLPVFIRGNPNNPGKLVPRRFLEVLSSRETKPVVQGSGRRELAEAITRDAAPLAARVIVNRVWNWHFDRPLVTTPGNFGKLGDAPSHPELLDDLAARFIASGWSLKWLHREIVLSATWQQSSQSTAAAHERDPANRLLSHMNRRRLEAESWRDAILASTAQLQSVMYGAPEKLDDEKNNRRTVYGVVSRQKPADLFKLFDVPDAKAHSEVRLPTTTPLQQLYLLNSPFVEKQSQILVRSLVDSSSTSPEVIVRKLFERILQREPTTEEIADALALVGASNGSITIENWTLLAHSLFAANEFLYVD